MKLKRNISYTSTIGILVGHVLVSVNPCPRCVVVALVPQIAKLSTNSQKIGSKICKLIWVGVYPLFRTGATFCHLEMICIQVRSTNLLSKFLPLKTSTDIPIIISCTTKVKRFKFGSWIFTSKTANIYTMIGEIFGHNRLRS